MADNIDQKAYVLTYGKQAPSSANVVIKLCKNRDDATIFATRDQAESHRKDFNLNGFPFESEDGSAFIFTAFEIEEGPGSRFWIYGEGPFAGDIVLP